MGSELEMRQSGLSQWSEWQKLLLDKVDSVAEETKECRDDLAGVKEDFTELKGLVRQQVDNTNQLLHIVRDGNGKAPLVLRMELAERDLEELKENKKQQDQDARDLAKARRNQLMATAAAILMFLLNILWGIYKDTRIQALEDRQTRVERPISGAKNGN